MEKISAKALRVHVLGHVEAFANNQMMYRVKKEIGSESLVALAKNYYLLEPWANKFRELNPRSTCNIEWCENGEFKRLFVMHAAALHVLMYSAQSLAVEDCAFMKAANYNGQFMAMSIVDGNLNNVLLAEALVRKFRKLSMVFQTSQ